MKVHPLEQTMSVQNILFPTDLSQASLRALPYAQAIAQKYGSKLYPVHISPEPLGAPASVREGMEVLGISPTDGFNEGIALLKTKLADTPYEIIARRGNISLELSQIISEKHIDLIVTGTHGREGIEKFLEGSVAEIILRHASCPVLTIGPNISTKPENIVDLHEILLATDLSDSSLIALPHALSLAQQNGSRLYLLQVLRHPDGVSEVLFKDKMRDLIPEGAQLDCEPKVMVRYGPIAQAVLESAEELAIDLIVMGIGHPAHFALTTDRWKHAYTIASQAVCPLLTLRQ